jgi:glycosyltransferase involved in cell wall biosynthesis
MRILYHHRTQAEDAQGIHICEMVKAFRNLGHQVEVMALVKSDQDSAKKNYKGLWQWLLRWMPNWLHEIMGLAYNLYGYWRLCDAIKLKRPDLIYERYALNNFCGIWASRRFRIPLVLEVNAPLYYEQSRLGRLTFKQLARSSERWICSHATWTVVVSNVMKDFLMREGIPNKKMIVMPNGVDPQQFHPDVCGKAVRERYGLDDKQVIGFVGWFRAWHGLEMLLEIMHEANLAELSVRLVLVGDGPAYPDLYRYAEQYDLLSAIIFTGPVRQSEVPAYIAAMDIAVQPSATEYACPMKLFEYMAMGRCVVAPDQPNIREILEDGVSGRLFRNKESLKSTLLELIQDPVKRKITARKAYTRIYEREFLWETNAQKTITLVFGAQSNSVPAAFGRSSNVPRKSLRID